MDRYSDAQVDQAIGELLDDDVLLTDDQLDHFSTEQYDRYRRAVERVIFRQAVEISKTYRPYVHDLTQPPAPLPVFTFESPHVPDDLGGIADEV